MVLLLFAIVIWTSLELSLMVPTLRLQELAAVTGHGLAGELCSLIRSDSTFHVVRLLTVEAGRFCLLRASLSRAGLDTLLPHQTVLFPSCLGTALLR